MPLSKDEAEIIAGIASDPAWILIMERLQAGIDDITERLYTAPTKALADEIFPYWKALRTIVIELKSAPEDMMRYLEALSEEKDLLRINQPAKDQLDVFVSNFNKMQHPPDQILPQVGDKNWNSKSYGNML